ncbi:acyltransferase [Glaciibacter superstes]|uniref:acyltransferase n=1 Tax=Glaciibacter superstes TaxID=501023 RepID=UPI003CCB9543
MVEIDHEAGTKPSVHIAENASVASSASIGEGSKVWDLAQVREGATLGTNCIIGRGAYVDRGVSIGDNSKVQNDALLYEPAVLGRGVFIGPAVVLTNDTYPRAVNPDGTQKSADDWEATGVTVEEGAAIGARAVCVAPARIGRWATVAAGAVVTKDVPDFALVAGVPARQIGWVGKSGRPLVLNGTLWVCPITGETYRESERGLTENER